MDHRHSDCSKYFLPLQAYFNDRAYNLLLVHVFVANYIQKSQIWTMVGIYWSRMEDKGPSLEIICVHMCPQTDHREICLDDLGKSSFSTAWPSIRATAALETFLSMDMPSTAPWISRSSGSFFPGREAQRPIIWTLGYRVLLSNSMSVRRKIVKCVFMKQWSVLAQ
jgi:hypothetical protein